MTRHVRWAAALAVAAVAGTLVWGTGGPSQAQEVLKIGAPLAATGADAR